MYVISEPTLMALGTMAPDGKIALRLLSLVPTSRPVWHCGKRKWLPTQTVTANLRLLSNRNSHIAI